MLRSWRVCFFFQNFKTFGVSDSLGERIRVFSVGNLELFFRINSRLASYIHRVHRSTREVWKARLWHVATHYFESEITSWLRTSKYIVHTLRHRNKVFISYSIQSSTLLKNWKTRNIIKWSDNRMSK